MFNKKNWETFSQKQPVCAEYATQMAKKNLEWLKSHPGEESLLGESADFRRFHRMMESNDILSRTGTLKEDLQAFVAAV